MRILSILFGLISAASAAQDGTPMVQSYMQIQWPVIAGLIDDDQRAIQSAAAARGQGCSSGTLSNMNKAISDRCAEYLNATLAYAQSLASSGYGLNKDLLEASIFDYRDSAMTKLIISACGESVTPNPDDVELIRSRFDLAVLYLATIFPVRDTLVITRRDTIIKRDTIVKLDTVKVCPPTLAKSTNESRHPKHGTAVDASGRSLMVWARCKE